MLQVPLWTCPKAKSAGPRDPSKIKINIKTDIGILPARRSFREGGRYWDIGFTKRIR